MRIFPLAVPLVAFASIAIAAPRPVVLVPSGKWTVDYGDQRCTLYRAFGTGKNAATLSFEQVAPRRAVSILMFGSAVPKLSGRANEIAFSGLVGVSVNNGHAVTTSKEKENGVYFWNAVWRGKFGLITRDAALALANSLPPGEHTPMGLIDRPDFKQTHWTRDSVDRRARELGEFSERADLVEEIILNPDKSRPLVLRTGSLKAPLAALEKCSEQGLKHWGIDPAVEETVAVFAHPTDDPTNRLTFKDYPQDAITRGKETTISLWLNIDASGAMSSCRPVSSFASPEINDKMCALIQKRFKFVPAKTATGQPVPSYYIQTMVFRLEG
jgi:hypothetical protein